MKPIRRQGDCRRNASEKIDVFMHHHRLELLLIGGHRQDRARLFPRETACKVDAELGFQQRNAFLTSASVTEGVFADDFLQPAASLNSSVKAFAIERLGGSWYSLVNCLSSMHTILARNLSMRGSAATASS